MLVVSLVSIPFLLPCFTGEGKRVACVRANVKLVELMTSQHGRQKNFMNQFCCHPQHVVQCVLQHPRKKGKRARERKLVGQDKVKAKGSFMGTF